MELYLRHVSGRRVGEIGKYPPGNIRIGRDDFNDITFDPENETEVSGRHALITLRGDIFVIEDLKSLNGTYVNGKRITEPFSLTDGDEIEFAPGGPKLVFSTKPIRSTLEVPSTGVRDARRVTKSPTLMISDAYRKAILRSDKRIGNATSVFFRELAQNAALHSSKRLRVTVITLSIVFTLIVSALISNSLFQQEQIAQLTEETNSIKAARAVVQEEREALKNESRSLQHEINRQAVELERLQHLVSELGRGGVSSKINDSGGVSVNLPNVLFDFDAANLAENGKKKIAHIAGVLHSIAPESRIFVEGHASYELGGNEERNLELSQERAKAVMSGLIASGLRSANVEALGYGSSKPLASNDSEAGRRQNRRVEVIIATPEQVKMRKSAVLARARKADVPVRVSDGNVPGQPKPVVTNGVSEPIDRLLQQFEQIF
jgi:outer membrane protein OmpA-like peptidoglycan-associated protein